MSSDFIDRPDSIAEFDQEKWREAHDGPEPADLRDQIEGPADWLRPAVEADTDLVGVPADGGLDRPLPEQQRSHAAVPPEQATQITRDTSLSRDVDVKSAGGDPAARHGMSDRSEIGHPGPLAPDAADQPAAADGEPAGQWGSSGEPTS